MKRFEVSSSLLIRNDAEPFLHRIVACDEKWVLYDNRERSAQWVGVDEPPKNFQNQVYSSRRQRSQFGGPTMD
ncbi:hypothetical protein V3C99_000951 [Haemonchus contortus]